MMNRNPSAYVFYHYFPPDDVVSAVHFGDLCSGLAKDGWDVTVFPTVWPCRDSKPRFPPTDTWCGVTIRRIWRPPLRQSSTFGRFVNAIWMIGCWSLLSLRRASSGPDVLIIGTDPIMSVLVAKVWKLLRPHTRIAFWCFDLYPEAAIADGLIAARSSSARILRRLLGPAYRACSVIADLGPCMRQLLLKYPSNARRETMVPWALDEPVTPLPIAREERERVFGETSLAILYSGSFGRAHSCDEILELAQLMEPEGAKFAFSIAGNRVEALHAAVEDRQIGIRFVPFAPANRLRDRVACTDVHMVTLRREWTGTVVPSKFFGALAVGRPVLFAGSAESSIAYWISKYKVGWVLSPNNIREVASELLQYASQPKRQAAMQKNCFELYRQHFAKDVQLHNWNILLRSLLA